MGKKRQRIVEVGGMSDTSSIGTMDSHGTSESKRSSPLKNSKVRDVLADFRKSVSI